MAIDPVGLRRRLDLLEARNAELARTVDAMRAEQSRRWVWPRDMFLGRTTALSESSYPTSGNTFQVELLEGDFLATEGDRDVNELARGKTVVARTWPEAYLPYQSDVIVKRIRGLGAAGRGEWYIEPSAGTAGRYHPLSFVDDFFNGVNGYGIGTNNMPHGSTQRLALYSLGLTQPSSLFTNLAVASDTDPAFECVLAGRYAIHIQTTWQLDNLTTNQAEAWYERGGAWGNVGPYFMRVRTRLGPSDVASSVAAYSQLAIRTCGSPTTIDPYAIGDGTKQVATHNWNCIVDLDAEEQISVLLDWEWGTPTDISTAGLTYPAGQLIKANLTAIYCGTTDNV